MKIINEKSKVDVEALKSLLLQRRTIRERFRLPVTEEQANDILTAAYRAEVEYRRGAYVADAETASNIRRAAKFLTDEDAKAGFMFCGVCGNGKTTLLYAIRNALNMLNDMKAFDRDTGMVIYDARELASIAEDTERFRKAKREPMIAIEDMGREATEILHFGNVLSPVIDLMEYRYSEQLFTGITTNLTPDQVREKYGRRVADRFREMLEVIVFKNGSYRK
ncbi:MAG: hypothetical protein ACI30I_04250 [Parabacteroides sp.]